MSPSSPDNNPGHYLLLKEMSLMLCKNRAETKGEFAKAKVYAKQLSALQAQIAENIKANGQAAIDVMVALTADPAMIKDTMQVAEAMTGEPVIDKLAEEMAYRAGQTVASILKENGVKNPETYITDYKDFLNYSDFAGSVTVTTFPNSLAGVYTGGNVADPAAVREMTNEEKRAKLLKELQALGPVEPKPAEELDPERSIRIVS